MNTSFKVTELKNQQYASEFDIEVKKDNIIKAKVKQIEDQSKELEGMKENQIEILKALDAAKGKNIKVSNQPKPIPQHLAPVHREH